MFQKAYRHGSELPFGEQSVILHAEGMMAEKLTIWRKPSNLRKQRPKVQS